ncbi:sugar ABC transporter ATP-binding protein [Pokkaliibacter sp. CJK22405]|uniref:sugar ABC transporter ATP-binding protein n=1 Tax=Pokkaliibacter sp. CJK22405 TaxID=3384615 RepID=UPI0039849C47
MTATTLKLERISKSFPGVKALSGINLEVCEGEIHALLGENGAGKSTLMKILSGIYQPDDGTIAINGKPMSFAGYNDAIAAGVGIIFQEFSLIPYLDAVENIFLGRELTNGMGLLSRAQMLKRTEAIFARLNVDIDLHLPVASLSVAEQQFVEIAKALALDARILILDEPTATLTPAEAEHLFCIMRDLKRQGVAMIFISHHLEEIFAVCDRISVLRDGSNAGFANVSETDVDALVEMMVGRRLEQSFPPIPERPADPEVVLDVKALQLAKDSHTNAFSLHRGEILGFAGLVGSGRTELALGLMGAMPAAHKEVYLNGQPVALKTPSDALKLGIGLLPESRKTQGLITDFSIRSNIVINNLGKYTGGHGLISEQREHDDVVSLMKKVTIKAPDDDTKVVNLSGGNQQKVVIARWLNHQCRILIFDEPTRGIDVGAKAEIYQLMRALTEQGYSIIMISSELPEVIGMCDRVAVFCQGAIVATLTGDAITANDIMLHATGGAHYGE